MFYRKEGVSNVETGCRKPSTSQEGSAKCSIGRKRSVMWKQDVGSPALHWNDEQTLLEEKADQ